jgi:hypothetical protein
VTFPLKAGPVRAANCFGDALPDLAAGPERVTIRVNDGPTYLISPQPIAR